MRTKKTLFEFLRYRYRDQGMNDVEPETIDPELERRRKIEEEWKRKKAEEDRQAELQRQRQEEEEQQRKARLEAKRKEQEKRGTSVIEEVRRSTLIDVHIFCDGNG